MTPIKNKISKKVDDCILCIEHPRLAKYKDYRTLRDAKKLGWCYLALSFGRDVKILLNKQLRSS